MGITAREVIFRIIGDTESLTRGIDQATKAFDENKKKAEAANKVLGDIAKSSALVVTAVGGIGIALGKMALDFSQGFSQVESLIPGATARILELKKNVQDLSVEQGRSTKDLTDGLYQVISTYGDTAEAAGQLTLASKAAIAGAATTVDSINMVAAVTKGYGDTSLEAQKKVADLSFMTVKLGQTTIPELARNIQEVVPLSKQLGVSQEELFNIFATGTGVIGNASEVSTKFKATLVSLMKPNQDLAEVYQRMGVVSGEALVSQNGLVGALDKIRASAEAAGVPFGNLFDSAEAVTLGLSFTGAQAKTSADFLNQLTHSAGSLDEAYTAATTGLNNFGFELSRTQAAATVLGQRLGDQFIKSAQDLLVPVQDLVTGLSQLDDETLANIVAFGKVIITAAATAAGVALVTRAIIGAGAAWRLLTAVMAANPLGLAIVGVVTAISVINELTKANENSALASIKAAKAFQDQKVKGLEMASQYEALQGKANKTFLEQQKLGQIMTDLKKLYPELTDKIIAQAAEQGKLKDLVEKTNKARNAEAINGLNQDKKRIEDEIASLTKQSEDADRRRKDASSALASNPRNMQAFRVDLPRATKDLDQLNRAMEDRLSKLQDIQSKIAELTGTAETPSPAIPVPAPATEASPGAGVAKDSQGSRLAALDAEYKAQRDLARQSGEDLVAIDASYLGKRKDLLESFVKDDVALGKSAQVALASGLAGLNGRTIGQELEATTAKIKEIAARPITTIGFEAAVKLETAQGVSLEDALKDVQTEATRAKDDALAGLSAIGRQQAVLTGLLKDSNLTDQTRLALQQNLAQSTERQTKLETDLAAARHLEEQASAQLLTIDLARINQTEDRTQESINREIALRKELGLLGTNDTEQTQNANKLRASALQEKQNALISDYGDLVARSKDATNKAADADRQKAEALRAQIKLITQDLLALGEQAKEAADLSPLEASFRKLSASWDKLFDDGKNKWKSFFSSLAEFAQVAGDQIKTTFDGVKNIATGLISNRAESQAQESNAKLTQLERDKNDALRALDDELTAMKKAHADENQAIAEAEAEATYQAQQTQYSQSITDLQNSLDQETNIAKAKQLEKDLEAARKAKREAQEARKKEKDDKARADKQTADENAILNQRAMQEWQFATTKVEIENAAGVAAAGVAQEKAKWDKASTVLSMTLLAVQETARAAASWPDVVSMGIHGVAAVIAGVQAGVAASAPEPSGYSPQPLPPQPVLLAAGGIFLPQTGGTNVTTSGGTQAKVAEAGVPEIFLPLTMPNLQTLFQAAGIQTGQGAGGFYYAPAYTLQFTQTDGTTKEEVFAYLKEEVSRDLLAVVEDAKRKFFLGDK